MYRDITAIIYTSGTTGPSKGVLLPWAGMLNMWSWAPADTFSAGEALYGAFPSFHVSGKSVFNGVVVRGGHLVYREKFSVAALLGRRAPLQLRAGRPRRPDDGAAVGSAQPKPDDADNPLRYVLLGPMIPEMDAVRAALRTQGRHVLRHDRDRCGRLPSASNGKPWQTCGRGAHRLSRGTKCGSSTRTTKRCPSGEVGELIVRTPEPWALNVGYYKMPEKTAEAWRNGWFHTGDAFRRDEDGWYYFVDRMKDAIRRRGENISSFEVENFVIEHPLVADCAAIGVPAQYGEDEVMVVCVVRPIDAKFSAADCSSIGCEPRMPKFMLPRYVDVVDDLPRNQTSMRVLKFELRAQRRNRHDVGSNGVSEDVSRASVTASAPKWAVRTGSRICTPRAGAPRASTLDLLVDAGCSPRWACSLAAEEPGRS